MNKVCVDVKVFMFLGLYNVIWSIEIIFYWIELLMFFSLSCLELDLG